jgi:hypothetical protein
VSVARSGSEVARRRRRRRGHVIRQIHEARKWCRTNREHQQLLDSAAKAQKALEAEQEKTAHALRELDGERREWQACFLQYHRRGEERGGREKPAWLIVAKSAAVALGAALIALPLGPFFWPLYLLPIGAGGAAFMHFRKTRFTPSYTKFRRQEATHFTITASPRPDSRCPNLASSTPTWRHVKNTT